MWTDTTGMCHPFLFVLSYEFRTLLSAHNSNLLESRRFAHNLDFKCNRGTQLTRLLDATKGDQEVLAINPVTADRALQLQKQLILQIRKTHINTSA